MWKRIRLTLEMIKFEHSVFALPFALTGALLAIRHSGLSARAACGKIGWIVVAMVGARSAAMAFNRLIDLGFDARNPRTRMRHLPTGVLSRGFTWGFVAVSALVFVFAAGGVLACGFVDFALLSFHFQDAQLARQAVIPLLFSAAMGLNGLTALFLGKLFDRYGIVVLSYGILISLLALPLGFLGGTAAAVASVACWATGMGAQDACLRSGIAQVVSMNKRGSAFGAFNGVYGIMWFLGSATMGLL